MDGIPESQMLGGVQNVNPSTGTEKKLPDHTLRAGGNRRPYKGNSYKRINIPGHPNANNSNTLGMHVYLAAKALGKPLPKGAEVHHHDGGVNGGQLVICQDHGYHMLLHARKRAYEATGDPEKRRCRYCKKWDDVNNMDSYYHPTRQPGGVFRHAECLNRYCRERYAIRRKSA